VVVEQGSHEELLAAEGIYATMWQNQLEDQLQTQESSEI